MCVDKKWVKNRYTGRLLLAKCGHCKACLQEKANARALRIKNTACEDYQSFMVNLDYSNTYVPYITRENLYALERKNYPYVHVYRDNFPQMIRKKDNYIVRPIPNRFRLETDRFLYTELNDVVNNVSNFWFPDLKYNRSFHDMRGKVGVCYYPDFQRFVKRLRKELYNLNNKNAVPIKYFVCAEYGTGNPAQNRQATYRPHFHADFFIPRRFADKFPDAVFKCWTYCHWSERRKRKGVLTGSEGLENYISTYINGLADLPPLFKKSPFSLCWHYSHDFGMGKREFQLEEIRKMYDRRDFRLPRQIRRGQSLAVVNVPVPSYVLGRYFPKFKGYRWLNSGELFRFLRACINDVGDGIHTFGIAHRLKLNYTWEDAYKVSVLVKHKFSFFIRSLKASFHDFFEMYRDVWTIRASNILRMFHEDDLIYKGEQYDNFYSGVTSDFRLGLSPPVHRSPNLYEFNRREHNYLLDSYDNAKKHKVANASYFREIED